MGIPFAAGLKASSRLNERYVPLAWSINGVMTVTGSVLGITAALLYGYTVVLIGGALIYAFGALAGLWLTRSRV